VIVYVETNFLLELAYLQERSGSCEEILRLAKARSITLGLPAFSVAEAYSTWRRKNTERQQFNVQLRKYIRETSRSAQFSGLVDESKDVVAALIAGGDESKGRLAAALMSIESNGAVIALTAEIISIAGRHEVAYSMSSQDALVLASVKSHAEKNGGLKCFITQDEGFDDPLIHSELLVNECKVIVNFADAVAYIKNALRLEGEP
jgi:predicted nucleic acid-binding protein